MKIECEGGFYRYEIGPIEEDQAAYIIENGLKEYEIEDFDLDEYQEQGLSGNVNILVDGNRIGDINIDQCEPYGVEPDLEEWSLIRMEFGSCHWAMDFDKEFDNSKLEFTVYQKNCGDNIHKYAWPMYDDVDLMETSNVINEVNYYVISPEGKSFIVDLK